MSDDFDQATPAPSAPRRKAWAPVDLTKSDRLPPHSLEAEQGVLGCVLLDPAAALNLIRERLGAGAVPAFYDLRHQQLFAVLSEMDVAGEPVDLIGVQQRLRDAGLLEGVGGLAYLSSLMDAVPSAANLAYYLDLLRDQYARRRLVALGTEMVGRGHAGGEPVEGLLRDLAVQAMDLTDMAGGEDTLRKLPQLGKAFIQVVRTAFEHRNKGMMLGEATGFSYLDKKCCGLMKRQVYVIGGESSVGKTSFLLSLTSNLCKRGLAVGYLSPESAGEELFFRLCCINSGADGHQLHSGFLSEQDKNRLTAVVPQIAEWPLHIDDATALSPDALRLKGRRLVQQCGARVLILDHLHEVTDDKLGERDKVLAFKWAMQAARFLARKFDIPVVVAAQLSREAQKEIRGGRPPQKTDLRESGYIEQMADFIGILHLDRNELKETEGDAHGEVVPTRMEICKQRNGPTGPVNFTFLRKTFRYEDRLQGTGDEERFARKQARAKDDNLAFGK